MRSIIIIIRKAQTLGRKTTRKHRSSSVGNRSVKVVHIAYEYIDTAIKITSVTLLQLYSAWRRFPLSHLHCRKRVSDSLKFGSEHLQRESRSRRIVCSYDDFCQEFELALIFQSVERLLKGFELILIFQLESNWDSSTTAETFKEIRRGWRLFFYNDSCSYLIHWWDYFDPLFMMYTKSSSLK